MLDLRIFPLTNICSHFYHIDQAGMREEVKGVFGACCLYNVSSLFSFPQQNVRIRRAILLLVVCNEGQPWHVECQFGQKGSIFVFEIQSCAPHLLHHPAAFAPIHPTCCSPSVEPATVY